MARCFTWLVAAGLVLAGCSSDEVEQDYAVTWHRDIRPIVDEHCVECHQAGGIAPFSMESYEEAYPYRERMAQQVDDRIMPPWLAGPGCTEYEHDRTLADADIATIDEWVALGAPEGRVQDAPAVHDDDAAQGLSRVDATIEMPEEYVAQIQPDDYRCFLIDWPEDTVKYVTGFRVTPGTPTVVHHVIAFVVGPAAAAAYDGYDAAEAGPGYTCFGGPGPGDASTDVEDVSTIGAWAPGVASTEFPAGTGLRVEPGSKVVLQVHYNSITAGVAPDRTSLDFRLEDHVDKEAYVIPWANPMWLEGDSMSIPAGETDVVHSFQLDPTTFIPGVTGFQIYMATLHMHLLGTSGTLKIVHPDGTEDCMLDVPRWDFHWQMTYGFTAPKRFQAGDELFIECHWDNSAANQPLVNGDPQVPADRAWGEGSTDEMCLGGLYVTF